MYKQYIYRRIRDSSYLQYMEEFSCLAPEEILLKWMNFQLKKAGYEKEVTNFSSDLKVRKSL